MEYLTVNIIGWIGFFLILLGYYFNAKKKLYCFSIWGIGNIIYIFYGYIIHAMPIMAMSLFVLIKNIYGYISWTKEENNNL